MYILQTLHCNTSVTSYGVAGKRQNLNTGQIKSELQPAAVLSHRGWQEQRLLLPGQSQSNLRLGSQIPKILQKDYFDDNCSAPINSNGITMRSTTCLLWKAASPQQSELLFLVDVLRSTSKASPPSDDNDEHDHLHFHLGLSSYDHRPHHQLPPL